MRTVDRARGRWREIFPALGVEARFLVNKHGPCPICGGRDRYRFDDRDGSGAYYCNQCGAGDGLVLLRKFHGWDYKTACDEVDKVIGSDAQPARVPTERPNSGATRLARIKRVLAEATDQNVCTRYLASRGLSVMPDCLLGHPRLPYFEDGEHRGRCPAMVAPIHGPDNRLLALHRTYLGRQGRRKKLTPAVDKLNGAAVRLFEPTDELGIAEGIETAIAAHELFAVPTWAAISTSVMESWSPPDGVTRALVFADNDVNFAGQKTAFTLANRLVRTIETVEVLVPDVPGSDWLDMLVDSRARSA